MMLKISGEIITINRPYSYSRHWTGTSLMWRLIRGILLKRDECHLLYIWKTPRLGCKLVPVQYGEYEYGQSYNRGIGDRDRKRAPFLVLGLSLLCGTIFLSLEQTAPSCAAHACTCCYDFRGCSAGQMASENPEIFYAFGPQLNAFMFVGILLKWFRCKLPQFEWSTDSVKFTYVPLCITDQVVFRYLFYKSSTLNFTYAKINSLPITQQKH